MTPAARARRAAALAVDTLCRLIGREPVVRAARFTLNRARLDLPNSPALNGEYALHEWLLAAQPAATPMTALDIGANTGEWSRALLAAARRHGVRHLSLHAFEPASATHRLLVDNVPAMVEVNRLAVSAAAGEATLHIVGSGAGTNSLYGSVGSGAPVRTERVPTTTVDDYATAHRLRRLDLVKIDTEGNDFAVLRGALRCFRARMISVAQFEYNHRWIQARHYLNDVFDLLGPLGYRIGKLTVRGVEFYPGWDPELETFVEANYLACTAEAAARLPRVAWWKRPNRGATRTVVAPSTTREGDPLCT